MIAQSKQFSKTIIILRDNTWLRVPPNTDPDTYRRQAEAQAQKSSQEETVKL